MFVPLTLVSAILLPLAASRPAVIPQSASSSVTAGTYSRCRKGHGTGYAHYDGWRLVGDDVSAPQPVVCEALLMNFASCPVLSPSLRSLRVSMLVTNTVPVSRLGPTSSFTCMRLGVADAPQPAPVSFSTHPYPAATSKPSTQRYGLLKGVRKAMGLILWEDASCGPG